MQVKKKIPRPLRRTENASFHLNPYIPVLQLIMADILDAYYSLIKRGGGGECFFSLPIKHLVKNFSDGVYVFMSRQHNEELTVSQIQIRKRKNKKEKNKGGGTTGHTKLKDQWGLMKRNLEHRKVGNLHRKAYLIQIFLFLLAQRCWVGCMYKYKYIHI